MHAKAKSSVPQFGKHTDFTKINMDQIISGVNMASNMLDNSVNQQFRSGLGSGMIDLGKRIGGKAGKGLQATGTAMKVVNLADSITNAAFGGGSETDKKNFLGKIPGMTLAAGLFGGRAKKFHDYTSGISDIMDSGMQSIFQNARDRSGSLFKQGKANRAIDKAEMLQNQLYAAKDETEMAKNNQAGQLYAIQNIQNQAGYSPNLLSSTFAKDGTKLPTVEECRRILAIRTQQFKEGGKLLPNVIPSGALHKDLNHLVDVNSDLNGQITKKGIPVISIEDGGDINQHAEIEREEITFSKPVTEQLEEFYNDYNKNENEEIALECGKFLVDQILKNTIDKAGLIKKVD